LCGQRYPRQRLHCNVGLSWKVAGRGRSSRGGIIIITIIIIIFQSRQKRYI